jgi:acetylornithine deacetylase
MHSSEAGFAVPDRCTAWLDLHVPPRAPIGELAAALEKVARDSAGPEERPPGDDAAPGIDVRFTTFSAGYTIPEEGEGVLALRHALARTGIPWKTGCFESHSDAGLFWAAGVRPLIFGPGQLAKAHTRAESVSFPDVERAARAFLALLEEVDQPHATGAAP